MTTSSEPALSIRELTFRYGSRGFCLGPISLDVHPGVTGLVGRNGAGKSTLMRVIAGLQAPTTGAVAWRGIADATKGRGRRQALAELGYVPQDVSFHGGATVQDVVHYEAWLHDVPRDRRGAAVEAALEAVDLVHVRRHRARKLSGGMQRRLGVAAAIVHTPSVLILDEPTAGLDPQQRVAFRALIRQLASSAAVLLSSHLVEDVRLVADHVAVVDVGRLVFRGSTDELLTSDAADRSEGFENALLRLMGEAERSA